MQKILIMALFALPLMTNAVLLGFEAEDGSSASATVSASLASDFDPALSDANALGAQYITTETDTTENGGTSGYPGANRIATYTVNFSDTGTYDLYARIFVAVDGADDSCFYGSDFGSQDATNETLWITCNGLYEAAGIAGEYYWVNLSLDTGNFGEAGVTFDVPSAGNQTFQIGGRETGLRFDAFAFGTSGETYTEAQLDVSVAGSNNVQAVTFSTSPTDGATDVAVGSTIVVTATDYGVHYAPLVDHAEMVINSNTVTPVVMDTPDTTNTTFTYTPPADLEYDTAYAVQLKIIRTDSVTNTVDFSFTTMKNYKLHVLYSGINQGRSQPMLDFLSTNYPDVLFTYGDYSDISNTNTAAAIAASDLLIIGRKISSTPFANAANSLAFNALTNPVVCLTSYACRPDGGRWGWHDGGATGGWSVTNAETAVTSAGALLFGVAAGSTNDWFTAPSGNNFYATGGGTVGGGEILATLGGDILAAHWSAGDMFGSGIDSAGGERLLFNLPEVSPASAVIIPDTVAGQQALLDALNAYTPLGSVLLPPSVPVIAAFAVGSGSVSMSWNSEAGVDYYIVSRPNLVSGSWQTNTVVPGTGAMISTNVPAGGGSAEFFRLEATR